MIQVLALRTYTKDGQTKTAERWFEKGIRALCVDEILLAPGDTLAGIEQNELYNIYYTVGECLEEPGRKFLKQSVVPFDIDGLAIEQGHPSPHLVADQVARVACVALGVDYEEVGVVFSGNGVQILVSVKNAWDDRDYFDVARPHYKAMCDKIDITLMQHKLQGKADPSVWSPARLMRHPDTRNRKPGKEERTSRTLQPNMIALDWSLETKSGLPTLTAHDHVHPNVGNLFSNDPTAVMDEKTGCDFIKYGFANQEKMPEPWWYAGLSIVGRFPDAMKWTHEFSKKHPKYNFQETEMKRKQACSDKSGPRTCKHIEGLGFACSACPQFGKVHTPLHIEGPDSIKTLNTGFRFKRKNKDGEDVQGPPDYVGLWKHWCRQHDYVSVSDSPDLYVFKEKYWEKISRDDVMSFADKNFRPEPMERERKEFYSRAKISNLVKKEFFEAPPKAHFNFSNGVYSLDEKALKPHNRSFNFRHVLECEFDQFATAPRFRQFMKEITCDRQELENVLQEFMGYVISGMDCIYDKALLLLGDGENGKSKFIEVLRLIAGEGATASVSTKDLVNEVHRSALHNKILNISEESSVRSFQDVEELKKMIAGGVTMGKLLYYQPFEFRNRAKFVMLCNRLPNNFDPSHGFFRRLLPVPFDAVFSNLTNNRDDKIMEKLQAELPGIFNYAIEGYERLVMQSRFTSPQESKDIIDDYRVLSDDIAAWMQEEVEISNNVEWKTLKESLYINYQAYCERMGLRFPLKANVLFFELKQKFRKMGIPWLESKHGITGMEGRKRFIHGIQFKADDAMTIHIQARDIPLYKKDKD